MGGVETDVVDRGPAAELAAGSGGIVSSVRKAIGIVELLAGNEAVRLSDVARTLGAPKSTTHRLLKELEGESMVARSGLLYCAGPRLFGLMYAAQHSAYSELRELALPQLERLYEQRLDTVHLAVLDRSEVLYIEKITGPGGARIPSRVGGRMPATCTALGKALIAFGQKESALQLLRRPLARQTRYSINDPRLMVQELTQARRVGYALEREEARIGLRCVAAPVRDSRGVTVAAVSAASRASSFNPDQAGPDVRRAAEAISQNLVDAGFDLRSAPVDLRLPLGGKVGAAGSGARSS